MSTKVNKVTSQERKNNNLFINFFYNMFPTIIVKNKIVANIIYMLTFPILSTKKKIDNQLNTDI